MSNLSPPGFSGSRPEHNVPIEHIDARKRISDTLPAPAKLNYGSNQMPSLMSSNPVVVEDKQNVQNKNNGILNIGGFANTPYNTQPLITHMATNVNFFHHTFHQLVVPLYSSTTAEHLESLSRFPQRNYVQNQVFRQTFQSQFMSNSPNVQFHNFTAISQQSHLMFTNNSALNYLQNSVRNPLSSQTYFNQNIYEAEYPVLRANFSANHQSNKPVNKTSRKRNDNLYPAYMSSSDVEIGIQNKTLLEGAIRINANQYCLAFISSNDKNEQDILIQGIKNRNRALEGDIVILKIKQDMNVSNENKQKLGSVVYIKEKVHNRICIGSLKLMPDKNMNKALFIPRDSRLPRLHIPSLFWPDNFYANSKDYENTLFLAKINDWYDTRFALGKIVSNIGMAGDLKTERNAILAQLDLDVKPYGSEFKHFYPNSDYVIPEDEVKLREDCRQMCIFSIDPYNCRDIDDALSCRKLENGNYEIGVHISDVSHYLLENTPLDLRVSEKASTVYMIERAYHMLPEELCMICSLLPGVDRLAFSVFWEITEDGNILNEWFSKTIINSCSQLAYEHAQFVLDDVKDCEKKFPQIYNGFNFQHICDIIKILGKLSSIFRNKRFKEGSLKIDQPKITFKLNPMNGLPVSFSLYDKNTSHQLIEEFMLLANITVAAKIYHDYPKLSFLRCHSPPSKHMLNQLANTLKHIGIELEVASAGELYRSLVPYVESKNADIGKAIVLKMLCAKPMSRAKYFCAGCHTEDFSHYALNIPLYTHFTSPIRRYADIMVHRLLASGLKYKDDPNWELDKVQKIAMQCNKQKYNAKKAEEMLTELYTLKYIELNAPVKTKAVVADIKEKIIDVIILDMGLNRRIYFNNDFPGVFTCSKNDDGTKLYKMDILWKATDNLPSVKQVIEVFSILDVEMYKGDDKNMIKVETKLVRPQ